MDLRCPQTCGTVLSCDVVDVPVGVSEDEWNTLRAILKRTYPAGTFDANEASRACAAAGLDSDVSTVMIALTRAGLLRRVQELPPRWELNG